MKQRLGIADALVKSPDILILDEPTTAIDPIGVVEILDLLRTLVHERGLAILLSSHLLTQVQSVCDRIGIFASGKLVGEGTVTRLASLFGDGAATIEVGLELTSADDLARAGKVLEGLAHVDRRRRHRHPARTRGGSASGRRPRRAASARRSSPPSLEHQLHLNVHPADRAVARRHLPHGARATRPGRRGRAAAARANAGGRSAA